MMSNKAERFRKLGHQVIDLLAEYLEDQQSTKAKVLNWTPPEKAYREWPTPDGFPNCLELFERVIEKSISLHHPNYMGHQINPPVPESALAALVVDVVNNGMGVYEMGMAGTVMERRVIELTAAQYGFGSQASGFLTSGGTLGNLTALLTARRIHRMKQAQSPQQNLAIVVSEESHYCIERAANIMGWSDGGVITVPVNDRFQMRTDLLPRIVDAAQSEGRQIVAVVGIAGTTSTGSYDDLSAIGQFCREHDLWFHVDGAHGAALAFSESGRKLVEGIELADSVVMDFHKMLLVPPLITSVIFRDGRHSYETFRQQAEYLWDENPDSLPTEHLGSDFEWFNLARRTFECTKTMMSLKVYALLTAYGLAYLDEHIAKLVSLGVRFGELLKAHASFEIPLDPVINIVCFRFVDPALDAPGLNRLNAQIRTALVEEGDFYIVQTMIDGVTWLRTTLANPETTESNLVALMERIESIASTCE